MICTHVDPGRKIKTAYLQFAPWPITKAGKLEIADVSIRRRLPTLKIQKAVTVRQPEKIPTNDLKPKTSPKGTWYTYWYYPRERFQSGPHGERCNRKNGDQPLSTRRFVSVLDRRFQYEDLLHRSEKKEYRISHLRNGEHIVVSNGKMVQMGFSIWGLSVYCRRTQPGSWVLSSIHAQVLLFLLFLVQLLQTSHIQMTG